MFPFKCNTKVSRREELSLVSPWLRHLLLFCFFQTLLYTKSFGMEEWELAPTLVKTWRYTRHASKVFEMWNTVIWEFLLFFFNLTIPCSKLCSDLNCKWTFQQQNSFHTLSEAHFHHLTLPCMNYDNLTTTCFPPNCFLFLFRRDEKLNIRR